MTSTIQEKTYYGVRNTVHTPELLHRESDPDCYISRFYANFRTNTPKNNTKPGNIPGLLQSRRINRYRVNRYKILNRYAFW